MAPIGTSGTQGVRKGRGRFGSVRRRIRMPAATRINANKVPMFVNWTSSSRFATEAAKATITPVIIVVTWGVLNLGWTLEAQLGSRPSRPIEKKIRGWPAWYGMRADVV